MSDRKQDQVYDETTFRTILSPQGQEILRRAAEIGEGLTGLTRLRRRFPEDVATLAHLIVSLRRKAATKFSRADTMYFLPEALEQATGEVIALYKGRRFSGFDRIVDLGCGIGGDTLGLSVFTGVVACEREGLRLRMARENLKPYGPEHPVDFVQADFTASLPRLQAFHWDPSRRVGGRRVKNAESFLPPLSYLPGLVETLHDGAVSLGPATPEPSLSALGPGEIETISLGGECRAMILWTGALQTARRRATLLPGGETLTGSGEVGKGPTAPPRRYVVVPDPAVIRAHLVRDLAEAISADFLDPHVALLTAEKRVGRPWTRCFEIRAVFPFSRRNLRNELAARDLGRVEYSLHGVAVNETGLLPGCREKGPVEARIFLVRRDQSVLGLLTSPIPETDIQLPEKAD